MKLGTQPLNIQRNPSALIVSVTVFTSPALSLELMTFVLMTSTGEQIVVATNPARNDAVKCVVRLSCSGVYFSRVRLNPSYVASWPTVMSTALDELGQTPLHRLA